MPAEQLQLFTFEAFCQARIHILPDGRFTGQLVRPVPPPVYLDSAQVMQRTGLCKRQAQRIMRQLGAQQRGPNCKLRLPAAVLDQHLQRTATATAC